MYRYWLNRAIFRAGARLYKLAIALLIYQESDEKPTNASTGKKSSDRF
ncbi:hypothetical protein [Microcoleus sp. S13_C5]